MVISRGSNKGKRSGFKSLILSISIGVIIGVVITHTLVCMVVVDGISMEPTYSSGDTLLISKIGNPDRGDILVFSRKGQNLIKRVIGIPGDSVVVNDSKVYINGSELEEKYINEEDFNGGVIESTSLKLKEGEYFVMGDNRNHSLDSRSYGVISSDSIVGTKLLDLG